MSEFIWIILELELWIKH